MQLLEEDPIAQRGEKIYADQLRSVLEIPENIGKIVIIDVDSGDYEIAASGEGDGLQANKRLMARKPGGNYYGVRVGYPVAVEFGGFVFEDRKP